MSIVSILGGLSAVNILSNSENIQIPYGSVTYGNTSATDYYIVVPFSINNTGYFDLTHLNLGFSIEMKNDTTSSIIYDETQEFGTITHGSTLIDNFNATFTTAEVIINPEFYANISVSASYSINLISFSANLFNVNLSTFISGG
jgi:hypothetical protein